MITLDGKAVSQTIREEIKLEVDKLRATYHIVPGLAVVRVGEDPASVVYVRNKQRACEEMGFHSEVYVLEENATEDALLSLIDRLNHDANIHGILVQLPLPKHISEKKVVHAIDKDKDADGFHPYNVGQMFLGKPSVLPCTPAGVMEILHHYKIPVQGKRCVVIGRSNIVGKPQAMLLLKENGTVTICHSRTQNLASITRDADILVCAIGKPHFVVRDMVKPGATVIDVGINRDENGKLAGDVDFNGISDIAYAATPVPGGVGPMTITMLLKNTLEIAKQCAMSQKSEM